MHIFIRRQPRRLLVLSSSDVLLHVVVTNEAYACGAPNPFLSRIVANEYLCVLGELPAYR